jgi:cysteine desulfurase / selenocysteine lyase
VSAQKAGAGARRATRVLRDLVHQLHRGVYLLAEQTTERFEGAREKVRAFINAASSREIVFTRSATR